MKREVRRKRERAKALEDFERLRDRRDELQRQADRADGAVRQLLAQLKREFKVGTVEAAEKLLREMAAELARIERDQAKAAARFEGKWGGKLK